MTKSHLAFRLSLASIATVMVGLTAPQNALAQNVQNITNGHGNGTTHGGSVQMGCCSSQSSKAVDPGVRGGPPGAGGPVSGLNADQQAFFTAAQGSFQAIETVPVGLGPGFNELSCGSCHIFPAVGGSSPSTNPQVTDANAMGATNVIPSFVTANGPIREARFVLNRDGTPDGGVHDLFSIQGRSDAPGCVFAQPNFAAAVGENNVIFRIPPPTFGDGLVEGVSDQSLQSAFAAQAQHNASVGISGHFNLSGNTGNITRFGWKAQNASMLMFAGEAYNVEEGVTNDLFPNKRNNPSPQCSIAPLPEDTVPTAIDGGSASGSPASDFNSDIVNFAMFMRLLAPPTPAVPLSTSGTASAGASSATSTAVAPNASTAPQLTTVAIASVLPMAAGISANSTTSAASSSSASAPSAASTTAGLKAFVNVGCAGCHTMNQTTGNLALIDTAANQTVSNSMISPFSDFAVHDMGAGLADRVTQGNANGFEFRSAPLWGVGQRVFFLHDGRTNNLLTAIEQHASRGSEANRVITQFNMLSTIDQQNILNFLRNL
jgi:CxxC motif-containing protein (DUF1111 family)